MPARRKQPIDKLLHSLTGIALLFLFSFVFAIIGLHWWLCLIVSYAIVALLAYAKEYKDRKSGLQFDKSDILATLNPIIFIKYILFQHSTDLI